MPARNLVVPLAGMVLYILLSSFVANRAKRLFLRDPEAYVIVSIHGFRSAVDTLMLALVWVLISPALQAPSTMDLFGAEVPAGYLYGILFAVFFWVNFRVRLVMSRTRKE